MNFVVGEQLYMLVYVFMSLGVGRIIEERLLREF